MPDAVVQLRQDLVVQFALTGYAIKVLIIAQLPQYLALANNKKLVLCFAR